jgi:hypothetical protein
MIFLLSSSIWQPPHSSPFYFLLFQNSALKHETTNYTSRILPERLTESSANREIYRILWNLVVHYRIHNSPSPVPFWTRWIQSTPTNPISPKIYCTIILPSTSSSFKWSLPFTFSNQNLYAFLIPNTCYTPSYHTLLYYITLIIHGVPRYAFFSRLKSFNPSYVRTNSFRSEALCNIS